MLTHAHSEIVLASPNRSSRIHHQNALTERAWKDAVQGLGNSHPMTTVIQTCDYYTTVYNRAEDEACYLVSQSKCFSLNCSFNLFNSTQIHLN